MSDAETSVARYDSDIALMESKLNAMTDGLRPDLFSNAKLAEHFAAAAVLEDQIDFAIQERAKLLAVTAVGNEQSAPTLVVQKSPIAWPSGDTVVAPAIVEMVGQAVDAGRLPEVERRRVTAGGPRAHFTPQTLNHADLAAAAVARNIVKQISPVQVVQSPLDADLAALKASFDQQVSALQNKHAIPVLPPLTRTKIPASPRIGVVICTYGSVPYVRLGLEAFCRNDDVEILVHDDCSPVSGTLKTLCTTYQAEFVSTPSRRVPTVGDLSGFVEGLKWGRRIGLDIVVKCSRRFIINKQWSPDLGAIMFNTQMPSACAACSFWRFGWRSELVAMHVPSWIDSGAMAAMEETVRENSPYAPLPEAWTHDRAREVYKWMHPEDQSVSHWEGDDGPEGRHHSDCDFTVRYWKNFPHNDNHSGYVPWFSVMGISKTQVIPDVLWHDSAGPAEYAALAQSFGLPYVESDYVVQPGS